MFNQEHSISQEYCVSQEHVGGNMVLTRNMVLTMNILFLSHPGGIPGVTSGRWHSLLEHQAMPPLPRVSVPIWGYQGSPLCPGAAAWLPWFAMATVQEQPRLPSPCCWTPQGIRSMEKHIPTGCHGNVAPVKQKSLCFHLDFPPSRGNTEV